MNREKEILLQLLLEKYGSPTKNEVAKISTDQTPKQKKRRRGKTQPTVYACERWTIEGIAMVHKMVLNKMTDREIAKAVGRSHQSIKNIRLQVVGNASFKQPVVLQYLALQK